MITMTEIARLTGVSQPTVSRVLNGNRKVDAAIRDRVLACAREHDYQPNVLAKGLQGRSTMLLGVLVPDSADGFFAGLAKEVEAEARKRGYSVILFNSGCDAKRELEYLDVVRRYRVDGVLAVPARETCGAWPGYAKKLDAPVVALTRQIQGLDSVYVDRAQAGAMVADHLSKRGYRRFLFIGEDHDEKYVGFRQVLEGLGFGDQTANAAYAGDEQLRKALQSWFRAGWGRAAVFAGNDAYALRVMDALRTLGLSVPGNVGVMGFDDTAMGRYLNPRLSSVAQPLERMAREAVDRLLDRIEHPGEREPLDLPLEAELAVREST